jgi:hypothetical protein
VLVFAEFFNLAWISVWFSYAFFPNKTYYYNHNRQKPILYWSVIFMTAKAEAMMRRLKQDLQYRLPSTYLMTDSFDSSGNPVLTIAQDSAWNSTDQYAVVRIQPASLVFTNGIGATQEGFSTHYVDVCLENNSTTNTLTQSVLSLSISAPLVQSVEAEAGVTRWYLCNLATTPTTTQMTAGNLAQTDTPDSIWRLNAAQ